MSIDNNLFIEFLNQVQVYYGNTLGNTFLIMLANQPWNSQMMEAAHFWHKQAGFRKVDLCLLLSRVPEEQVLQHADYPIIKAFYEERAKTSSIGKKTTISFCEMLVYESDGSLSEFCGNGSRCITGLWNELFPHENLVIVKRNLKSLHLTYFDDAAQNSFVDLGVPAYFDSNNEIIVKDLCERSREFSFENGTKCQTIKFLNGGESELTFYFAWPGEPHLMTFNPLTEEQLVTLSDKFNTNPSYKALFPLGINLNSVTRTSAPNAPMSIFVRSYERGVNHLTDSCGTGSASSAAIAFLLEMVEQGQRSIRVETVGGTLTVNEFNGRIHLGGITGYRTPFKQWLSEQGISY